MLKWLEMNRVNIPSPVNSEESAVSRMGRKLYNLLVKNYVKKQWDLWPNELDPEVLDRIPVRTNFDDNYFSDKYQCMPKEGFTKMFQNILSNKNISVKLNTNFFDLKNRNFKIIIFTGKIDDYFNKSNLDKLQYRSMEFHFESINKEFFQDVAVVSYPNTEMFTRITEPKHSTLKKTTKTTIIKEFPTWGEEPYYPIFSKINKDLYSLYKALAEKEKNIYFIGRLAQYKYFDMDDAFKNALDFFDKIKDKI